jgi:protein-disulfide isomerase
VLEDYNDGLRLGVQATPTFFINGTQIVGAQPYENFQQLIEAELARAGQ